MAHWLVKSEPGTWSFDQQVAAGDAGTFWNGVRNHAAKNSLMAMRLGEEAFFYHSGAERRIVGTVEVIRAFYPDHTDATGKFGMVDVKAKRRFAEPVTLEAIKRDPRLAAMVLVKNSRLSVQPVTEAEWTAILAMAGERV
jgi:predicted RNA-binding protein with PUA-like domain